MVLLGITESNYSNLPDQSRDAKRFWDRQNSETSLRKEQKM